MAKRTVLVTGASRGIGKAIAIKFAKKGYNVVINCLNRQAMLEQVKKEVESYQVKCLMHIGDIGDYKICEELFEQIHKHFGPLDVLVNNAGISYIGLFQEMKPEDWNRIIQVNLNSVFYCTQLAIRDMLPRKKGKIVNISSVWGITGASCEVAYSAAKGAVNSMTKSLAKELGPSGIQINAIACGAIDTEMNNFMTDDELMELIEEIPLSRLGKAEEVADLVYHLSYKDDTYLTGQVIALDGGWI